MFIKLLGKGTIAEVYLTKFNNSNDFYATKKIKKNINENSKIKKFLENEKKMLSELKHPNIIKLERFSETQNHYILTLEYCNGGSLEKCLKNYIEMYKKPFSEEIIQYLMKQIIEGVKYIHQHDIIHCDLKLDNIFVKFYSNEDINKVNMLKSQIKISKFRFSRMNNSFLGNKINMDPLILKRFKDTDIFNNLFGYDKSVDIWSLGTLCYEMLIGQWFFNERNKNDLLKKLKISKYTIPSHLSKEVIFFLKECFKITQLKD